MKTCNICHNVYHIARLHCPTCGAFEVGALTYDIESARQLVVAYGAQRQNHTRTVRIAVTTCDPDQ